MHFSLCTVLSALCAPASRLTEAALGMDFGALGPELGRTSLPAGPCRSDPANAYVSCSLCPLPTEQTWPGTHETLLTTWKIVAFTATSVLLVLLLVILARLFQTKFKAHFPARSVLRPGTLRGLRAAERRRREHRSGQQMGGAMGSGVQVRSWAELASFPHVLVCPGGQLQVGAAGCGDGCRVRAVAMQGPRDPVPIAPVRVCPQGGWKIHRTQ